MLKRENVSLSVIRRLPRYHRFLADLMRTGTTRISSKELSRRMGLTASQIRQDLNCFGGFGQQGYGYNVEQLHREIGLILGLDKQYPAILVGAGNIGRAIALNFDFSQMGFDLIGIFDIDPSIIGMQIGSLKVEDAAGIDAFCREHHPRVAVLTVPRSAAEQMAEQLIHLGVSGFWNFSHYDFSVKYPGVLVENVHLSDSLMTLCYMVRDLSEKETRDN
ncbi:redox-sensing transcriptional repressor Rex [Ethanoligenens harbinense]|uniref:Redox-sensing transcriptional repressor Rex n=1 Tax=Ethanoligenens harbinense (strain DSM 18485 / JCM 12961 / CGMCC 1.5033 / YUAN-3) TaxID=663278 RepID=E6U6V7_ETHHY|nr:redox-sensing transcriptional repressor Rex [Ethanoligenens harbinense]ADU26924.1 Rex DNA-binding domain protein [Ethanoligenens harbinense YUAN-3]AVQ96019.1 redox-sensing transcriptional repressor Rex [Ethanoligenens harbinense YUAN-3]AYF38680.1 redox-sensing transcriptional repressor Rex [Ethanoligenens harbinense]AYF41427.1 redox-sensing transcriptional repressor Rex [Ethanoligenens harbinense]QCN92261.1 redox-sensing transcriptional repressor Rex [Ethanoligenens harbinense]